MVCILVVEDEFDIREMLVEFMTDEGYEVVASGTADAAVALLANPRVGLLVTDINLPGHLDGIDLAKEARERSPHIPIVFVSGRPNKLEEAHVVGDPVAFLQKPFSLRSLVADVQRLVAKPPRQALDHRRVPDVHPGLLEPLVPHPGAKNWELMQASLREVERSYDLMQSLCNEIGGAHRQRERRAEQARKLYQFNLLHPTRVIAAAACFSACSDNDAIDVAVTVSEAASDAFHGYELWHDGERIAPDHQSGNGNSERGFEKVIQLHQDTIADLEERLQTGYACVSRSRQLVELSAKLRGIGH